MAEEESLGGRRPDGRTSASSLRPLSADISCLHRADGSAKFSSGNTCVLAAVYGPASPKSVMQENPCRGSVVVVFKHGLKQQSSQQRQQSSSSAVHGSTYGAKPSELEKIIGNSLETCILLEEYPRTIIEVVLQVLQADGSVLSVAMNAAVLACLDAGISMTTIPIGTTCLASPSSGIGGSVMLDPSSEEEQASQTIKSKSTDDKSIDASPTVVFLVTEVSSKAVTTEEGGNNNSSPGMIASFTSGAPMATPDTFFKCIDSAHKASRAVVEFIRMAIENKVERESSTLWAHS
jgi:exosome complex component RRP46